MTDNTRTPAGGVSEQREATLDKRPRFWNRRTRRLLAVGVPLALVLWGVVLGASALVAKTSLESVLPLAREAQDKIASGDAAGVATVVDEVAAKTGAARFSTGHPLWRAAEAVPFVGDDLAAVRLAAAGADELVEGALRPLSAADISAIGPVDGAFNLDVIATLAGPVAEAAVSAEKVQIQLLEIDHSTLLPPVEGAVRQFTDLIDQAAPVLRRLQPLVAELPMMLGASEPRDYLVLVQNNAEARSTGGNPAAMMMLTADQGRLTISRHAGTLDFNYGRPDPIIPLAASTEELYGTKVGEWVQDITMTPDFSQTATLARAFWSETLGDPGDAVLSVDPVTLSYLLEATGPVQIQTGDRLDANNVVPLLLNEVYYRYPGMTRDAQRAQDAFFAASAASIFGALTSGSGSPLALGEKLAKAYGEGRILYWGTTPMERELVEGTTLAGPMTRTEEGRSLVGVFVNDNTEGKLDYYTSMGVDAKMEACEEPTFTATAKYDYRLEPGEVASLPDYISTGRYFPRGVKSTNLVFYGPEGSRYVSATIDGQEVAPIVGTTDLGYPAVRVLFESQPATSHTIEVKFVGGADVEYGPIDVRHTPMISDVQVNSTTVDCAQ